MSEEWISVKKGLPENEDEYIIYPEHKYAGRVCYFNKYMDTRGHVPNTFEMETNYGEVTLVTGITHYRAFPPPPSD